MGANPDARFLPEDAEIIRHKVKKLIGRYGKKVGEDEDLRQELAMHVSTRMDQYDPARGARSTFVDRLVGNMLANIIERASAKKRGFGKVVQSLDALPERMLIDVRDPAEAAELILDVRNALASLPPDLCEIVEILMVLSPAEAERALGLTRGQVRQRLARIGDYLTAAGVNPHRKKAQPKCRSSR